MSIERLYKYGGMNEYSEQLFSSSTIWQASAASLNDPFECTPSFVFTHEPDKIMAQLIRTLRRNNPILTHNAATAEATAIYLHGNHRNPAMWDALHEDLIRVYRHKLGLYCITERRDSILMWSHYAADHTGYASTIRSHSARLPRVSRSDTRFPAYWVASLVRLPLPKRCPTSGRTIRQALNAGCSIDCSCFIPFKKAQNLSESALTNVELRRKVIRQTRVKIN